MKIEIKNRFTDAVLFSEESLSLRFSVEAHKDSLSGADLRGADLSSSDLRGANLRGANLSGADLRGADLRGANLSGANLRGADLSGANLRSANLRGADLSGADLRGANLSGANLRGANLRGANLRSADLSSSDLRSADLSSSDLSGANLSGAKGADLAIARTRILPEGHLVGWKKLRGDVVAKLLIPAEAKRSHAFGRKCRAESAVVVALYSGGKELPADSWGTSLHNASFRYRVGTTVRPSHPFSDDWADECASGIHFFITREEAEAHEL